MIWLTKALGWLLLPPGTFLLLLGTALLLLWRGYRRTAAGLVAASLAGLYLLSIPPLSDALLAPLEGAYPVNPPESARCEAIAVMSGGISAALHPDAPPEPSATSMQRLLAGWRLWQRLGVPLLVSGGNTWDARSPEAEPMARTLRELGVPARQIVVEARSRNTFENARETRAEAVPRGWRTLCLVTSAYHLPRTVWAFRAAGLEIVPIPTGFAAAHGAAGGFWKRLVPTAGTFAASVAALREYLAFAWYALRYGV